VKKIKIKFFSFIRAFFLHIEGGGRHLSVGCRMGGKEVVSIWLADRLRMGQVPRLSDLYAMAQREGLKLSRKDIRKQLEVDPVYMFNLQQQKKRLGSRKYRPVLTSALGYLHADIGFFQKSRHYETPVTFRSGFLVAKDILSRFTYLVVLRKNRKKSEMVSAFETLQGLHKAAGHTHPIRGISFDRERSVMSNEVQSYFKENNMKFTPFTLTSSKAKFAESAVRLIKEDVARLERFHRQEAKRKGLKSSQRRWWNLLGDVSEDLNNREIIVEGKRTGFTPKDVNEERLSEFLSTLYKAAPAYFVGQFELDPRNAKFKYPVGIDVRPKLISTSSAVIGTKHSITNLEDQVFRIVEQIAYVTKRLGVGISYLCVSVETGNTKVFDEDTIVPTNPEEATSDRHAPFV